MRPSSVKLQSGSERKYEINMSFDFDFEQTPKKNYRTKSLTKNIAFDYLCKPMTESYQKRLNKILFKDK